MKTIHYLRSLSGIFSLVLLVLHANSTSAQVVTNAYDVASNYPASSYGPGNGLGTAANGSLNDGFGFQPWIFTINGGNGGAFIQNSGPSGQSFDIWQTGGAPGSTIAIRPFDSSLAVGQSFSVQARLNSLDGGSTNAIQLEDVNSNVLFSFFHVGGDNNNGHYIDAGGLRVATNFQYSYQNFVSYIFTLTSPTTYTFSASGPGFTSSFSGTLSGATVGQVAFSRANTQADSGSGQDFQFDQLMVASEDLPAIFQQQTPAPGAVNAYTSSPIGVQIVPGSLALNGSTLLLQINGMPVTPTSVSNYSGTFSVQYVPNPFFPTGSNNVQVSISDVTGNSFTNSWDFFAINDDVWTNLSGGNWSNPLGWYQGVVASGAASLADFNSLKLTANTTVNLDAPETIGSLLFGDNGNAYGWNLNGSNPLTLASTNGVPTITVSNQTATISVSVNGTNGLAKAGAGTLVLGGANNYTGQTTINAGTLILTGSTSSSSGTTIGTGTLQLGNGGPAGVVSAGPITFTGGSGQSFVSLISSNSSTTNLTLANNINFSAAGTYANFSAAQGCTLSLSGVVGNNGELWANGGLGTVVLLPNVGSAARTGNTVVANNGTLQVNDFSANTFGSGQLYFGPGTINTLNYAGPGEFAGEFGGVGTGSYAFQGSGSEINVINPNANLTLATPFAASGNVGQLIKTGPGTLTFNESCLMTMPIVVSNGTLEVDNTLHDPIIVSGGRLDSASPGNGSILGSVTVNSGTVAASTAAAGIGTFDILNGTLSLSPSSTVWMQISKTGGSAVEDQLQGMSGVTYGGTLDVTNITSDGTPLAAGDTFQLFYIYNGSHNGSFSAFNLPSLPAGLSWDVTGLATSGSIAVVATPAPPLFTPPSGNYIGGVTVTISSITPSATIYYTTNGTAPSPSSPNGVTPVTVVIPPNQGSFTIMAYASASGYAGVSSTQQAVYSTLSTAIWENTSGGSWQTPGNWSNNVIGNGIGMTDDFSQLTLASSPTTVTLDGSPTVGSLIFADQGNANTWSITPGSGGSLTLNNGANTPVINVVNTNTTIAAVLNGTNGFTKAGAGTLTLSATEGYTGLTTVNGGTLVLASAGAYSGLYLSSGLVINNGATVLLNNDNALSGYGGQSANSVPVTINAGGTLTGSGSADGGSGPSVNVWGLLTLSGGALAGGGTQNQTAYGTYDLHAGVVVNGGVNASTISCNDVLPIQGGGTVFNVANGGTASGVDLVVSGSLIDGTAASDSGIIKTGAGAMQLLAQNNYQGPTIVSNGTLEVDGSISSTVTVAGGILSGIGTVAAPVVVASGGALHASTLTNSRVIGTLSINNNLTFNAGSTSAMRVNKNGATLNSDLVQGVTNLVYGGTLTVTNISTAGNALTNGDTFKLFQASRYSGAFANYNLPVLGAGLVWNTTNLAVNGTIQVVVSPVNTAPTNIIYAVSSGVLTLSWPADHTGWRLLVQTNHLASGVSSNPVDWGTVAGSATTNRVQVTLDPTKPTEFYQLVYP